MDSLRVHPIGMVKESGFSEDGPKVKDVSSVVATIEILREYSMGLAGLEGEQRVDVVFWLDRVDPEERRDLMSRSSRPSDKDKGVFATRRPQRPNPIGVTRVELIEIEKNRLTVKGLDAYPGTPILDIKPARQRLKSGAKTG